MKIFISGGCKNGKSTYAQRLAIRQQRHPYPLYYIATMTASDHEDEERITRHKNERAGWGFATIEQPRNIESILEKCDRSGSFLLDSLTALLANEMFPSGGEVNDEAVSKIAKELFNIFACVQNIVIVSDYIFSDAAEYDALTESYRKSLAQLDRLAAAYCDVVLEAAFGQIIVHKGGEIYNEMA
jgi:adenosylcobinamide kinase/adenosylcobinamide-phosphate guanylyltransferase